MEYKDFIIPFDELVPDDVIADLYRLRSALFALSAYGYLETIDKAFFMLHKYKTMSYVEEREEAAPESV